MSYYLVQRIKYNSWAAKEAEPTTPLEKLVASNAFGGGKLFGGAYDLDYMGSSEFEWGAIPTAKKYLAEAKPLVFEQFEYKGTVYDFIYRGQDGEPFEAWVDWIEGRRRDYSGKLVKTQPLRSKEIPYRFARHIEGRSCPDFWLNEVIWWAIEEGVMWSFADEDRHLLRMLESIKDKG